MVIGTVGGEIDNVPFELGDIQLRTTHPKAKLVLGVPLRSTKHQLGDVIFGGKALDFLGQFISVYAIYFGVYAVFHAGYGWWFIALLTFPCASYGAFVNIACCGWVKRWNILMFRYL